MMSQDPNKEDDYHNLEQDFLFSQNSNMTNKNNNSHANNNVNTTQPQLDLLTSFVASSRGCRDNDAVSNAHQYIPHQGSLCRIAEPETSTFAYQYIIQIKLENGKLHELRYERQHYDFMTRLFAILDTESRGSVSRATIMEFVTLRCPVFWRRDDDLRRLGKRTDISPTFNEVWKAVVDCSKTKNATAKSSAFIPSSAEDGLLGVEGWMVFCRFIALAQYLEARRRFSARHLQQTMRHRNSPRGSEVVVVDVPPPEPPTPLTPTQLERYERKIKSPLPLPELDLDHSLVAVHDDYAKKNCSGKVKISLFGSPSSLHVPLPSNLEFAVTFTPSTVVNIGCSWSSSDGSMVVRRSYSDMKWLNDTFTSHKKLGGTLCGRILPPFPSSESSSNYKEDDSSSGGSGGRAIAAAAAGVGMIKSAAKSFWGNYVTSTSSSSSSTPSTLVNTAVSNNTNNDTKRRGVSRSLAIPENYYNPNSPLGKARKLERYLNYLLEHPALSTSFPLNTILKASQSGLEAAKLSLDEHAKSLKQQQSHAPRLDDGKSSLSFWTSSTNHQTVGSSSSNVQPNLSWVRTAAQAAIALKVHGILETTGLQSASARLQHASLPSFASTSARKSIWVDDEDGRRAERRPSSQENEDGTDGAGKDADNFERGVVHVQSELQKSDEEVDVTCDDGYDLLPLPVPPPERRILCAGSNADEGIKKQHTGSNHQIRQHSRRHDISERFHYGSPSRRLRLSSEDTEEAFLGDFSIDDDIDKLREVIGSVDNTLSRCLAASVSIGKSRRDRHSLHLDIVRGFDSWEGLRGKFVGQRALLKGVAGLEQSRDVSEESDLEMVDDVSWQTSLASAAVSAAEDVRSTVRAARTASSAKAAADSAALAAQSACDNNSASSVDEARAAQTRASIAQSHAIHAAVVEHEAKTAKRRATMALAHDVKCWNVHRKRELLRSCLKSVRSQLEASRRAVDAWSCLRDGYLGSDIVPLATSTTRRCNNTTSHPDPIRSPYPSDLDEVSAAIFTDKVHTNLGSEPISSPTLERTPPISILPVDHDLLANEDLASNLASLTTFSPDSKPLSLDSLASTKEEESDFTSPLPVPIPVPLPFSTDDHVISENQQDSEQEGPANIDAEKKLNRTPSVEDSTIADEDTQQKQHSVKKNNNDSVDDSSNDSDDDSSDDDSSNDSDDGSDDGSDDESDDDSDNDTSSDEEEDSSKNGKIDTPTPAETTQKTSRGITEKEDFDFIDNYQNITTNNAEVKKENEKDDNNSDDDDDDEGLACTCTMTTDLPSTINVPTDNLRHHDNDMNNDENNNDNNDKLSASMQSLVDGLMNWGGKYDDDKDLALPSGMAASIVLEAEESLIK